MVDIESPAKAFRRLFVVAVLVMSSIVTGGVKTGTGSRAFAAPAITDFGTIASVASGQWGYWRAPAVDINDSGSGLLTWTNSNGSGSGAAGLKYATFSGSTDSWGATSSITTSSTCQYPQAAVSPNGNYLTACYKTGSPTQVLVFPKTSSLNWPETALTALYGGHIRTAWRAEAVPMVQYTNYSAVYRTYSTRLDASSGTWGTPQDLTFCAYGDYSGLAMSSDGTAIMSMSGPSSSCNSGVSPLRAHMRSYDASANTYAAGVLDARSSAVTGVTYTNVSINDAPTRKGVIAYSTSNDKNLHLQTWTLASGFGPVIDVNNASLGASPIPGPTNRPNLNVAIDNSGNILLAWVQSDGSNERVRWSYFDGSTWTSPAWLSDAGQNAAGLTMAMARTDGVAILGYHRSDGSNTRVNLHEFSPATKSWTAASLVSPSGTDAAWTSVAMNSTGKFIAAWGEVAATNWTLRAFGSRVVADNTAPVTPNGLALAASSDSGSSNSDRITNDSSPTITGSTEASASVQLYVDGVSSGAACTADGLGVFECTTAVLSAGSRSITAVATDAALNSSAASTPLTVVVDTTAPAAPTNLALAALSDTGMSTTDRLTNDTTPTVEGTTEANAVVQLSVDGTPSGSTCAANGSGQFSCTASPVSEASHNVTAVATDVAGNSSAASASLSFDVDITPVVLPSSMLGSLTCRPTWCDSDYISSTATPSFVASAPNDTYAQLYISGTATGSSCTTTNGVSAGTFTCTTATLANGSYSVTAKLFDLAGNESTSGYTARAFQVTSGYVPTTTTSTVPSSPATTTAPTTLAPATTSSSTSSTTAPAATTTTTVAVQTGSGRLVWYADSEVGSDSAGTGSQQAPFKTFHRAYSAARAGDIIDLTGTFTWSDAAETGDVAGAGYRLSKNLTIRGQGEDKTIVEAASRENVADRAVFTNGAVVTIADLTVRHGKVTGGGQGGGITNRSQLTLRSMTVRDNRSVTASRYSFYTAGGVFTDSNTTLTMDKVTVKDNVCDCILYAAGGVYALQSAKKTITNSTFAGNRASASRIGPYPYSYASAAGAFNTFRFGFTVITNSTFFGNYSADYAGAINIYYQDYANLTNLTVVSNDAAIGAGGILYRSEWDGYNLNMKNVLLANNRGGGEANDFHAFNAASASRMTSSHNIVEFSTNKTFSGVGEIVGQQDSLDLASVLAPNGTRNGTDTLLVGRDSIAKDAGDAAPHGGRVKATPAETDQRGLGRSGQVDIGAFESQNETTGVASIAATTSTSSTNSTTSVPRVNTTLPRPPTTLPRSTTTSEVPEVTINPNIVATTAPTASTIPDDDAEDLTVEPTTDTEVRASNDSVEIVLSIVDKSFSALVQGRTGRLVAKQGLFARIRGKGFLAGSLAEVWVYSTPRLLAHLQVSGKGEAAGYVLIPEDMELGDHKVELRGKSNRRRVVKATIPLTILDDGVPASTIPPSAADLETALQLPTLIPALVLPAPTDGVISIGEDVISGVLAEVLGESFDLSKVKVRLRINKSEWQLVDTSTGNVIAVVAPVQTGENQIEFEVTDENGETVVVQRKVLVEGTPEATAYVESQSPVDSSDSSWWRFLLVVVAVAVAAWLVVVATRRRRQS